MKGVLEELDKLGSPLPSLKSVRIAMGDLHQVVPDTLEFAYTSMTRGTAAEGSELQIRFVSVEIKCGKCGWQGGVKNSMFLCADCKATEIDVLHGMEMLLENLEVEK